MKLLLVDPPSLFLRGEGLTRQVQPLGLASVGAAVADLAQVRFLLPDTRAWVGDDPWAELVDAVVAEAPDLLGLTAVSVAFSAAAELARRVRLRLPDLPIVLGGVHASVDPLAALREATAVDAAVQGEGEAPLRAIVSAWRETGDWPDPATVPGLVLRRQGRLVSGPPAVPVADLDGLPPPLREGLVWAQDVQPAFYQAMITVRGCPYHCTYCAVPGLASARTRLRSPSSVVDEIAALRANYGIDYLFFHDSVFTLHRKRTLALCDEMIRRDQRVAFCCQTRADRVDPALLAHMVAAGLHQIFFGLESGNPETLRRIRKDVPLERARAAVDEVRALGVRCSGFFMVGFPWEDAAAITRTLDFACSLDLDAISLFSATPLPGTALWQEMPAPTLPVDHDFRGPGLNLTAMTDEAYRALFARCQRRVDDFNAARMMRASGAAGPMGWA